MNTTNIDKGQLQVISSHACLLGECPVWDDRFRNLMWVDILNGHIHIYDTVNSSRRTISVHEKIGSIALTDSGKLVGALQSGFAFIDPATGAMEKLTDPERDLSDNRFNDGKCDPVGRFWAGTMSLQETPHAGNVYALEADQSVTKKITAVTVSNGMAWSADAKIFYYIDTPTCNVVAYSYDPESGEINNKQVIITLDEKEGYPDGMTIDEEGMLWIALWGGWKIVRCNPFTGKIIYSFSLPVSKVTSCTFGGEQLTDLYITTASISLQEKEHELEPLAGALFVIRDCGFKGMPAHRFKG